MMTSPGVPALPVPADPLDAQLIDAAPPPPLSFPPAVVENGLPTEYADTLLTESCTTTEDPEGYFCSQIMKAPLALGREYE